MISSLTETSANNKTFVDYLSKRSSVDVAIICITYNQETYIRDAVESFLAQEFEGTFEIVVHDDASTDSTLDILLEYEERNPDKIHIITEDRNQYSQGVSVTERVIPFVTGKYVALCEGDDYWIDKKKLSKQYEMLIKHPEISLCVGSSVNIDGVTGAVVSKSEPFVQDTIIQSDAFVRMLHSCVTATFFMKKNLYLSKGDRIKYMKVARVGDYTLELRAASEGDVAYISDPTAVYRVLAKGSITLSTNTQEARVAHWENLIETLRVFRQDSGRVSEAAIDGTISELYGRIAEINGDWKALRSCTEYYGQLRLRRRLSLFLKIKLPGFYEIVTKARYERGYLSTRP